MSKKLVSVAMSTVVIYFNRYDRDGHKIEAKMQSANENTRLHTHTHAYEKLVAKTAMLHFAIDFFVCIVAPGPPGLVWSHSSGRGVAAQYRKNKFLDVFVSAATIIAVSTDGTEMSCLFNGNTHEKEQKISDSIGSRKTAGNFTIGKPLSGDSRQHE